MELPSWLNAAPAAFGTTQHGKLSADQWRTVGTLNLPITLIRRWGVEVLDEAAPRSHPHLDPPPPILADDRPEDNDQDMPRHESFRLKMLRNFLDLVDAVETIGLLEITEEEIES